LSYRPKWSFHGDQTVWTYDSSSRMPDTQLSVADGVRNKPADTVRRTFTPATTALTCFLRCRHISGAVIPLAVLIAGGGVSGLSPIPCGQTGCYSCEFYSVVLSSVTERDE